MSIKKEFDIVRSLVDDEGYITEMIVDHLASRKIHHSLASLILAKTFDYDISFSKEIIYKNEYYAPFKNEFNPFNKGIDYKIDRKEESDNTDFSGNGPDSADG